MRKISFILANYIYRKEHSTHLERHGYYYVLLMLISQIGEIGLILALSFFLHIFKYTIVILITFIILRIRFNTFHCKKMKTCTVYSTVLLLSTSLLSRVLSVRHNYILISVLLTIGLVMVTNSKLGAKLLREIERFYF
ncbi:accessory gene regulator B family protein [Clostridium felsineum]|uniref:accessory gene regulator B family protein n=1 Tax=Clostridium felsineum TaxID=36839 RepID=UPI00358DB112|nr:accessory gene regulator B family protein [Clostridium felsineum]